MTLHLRGSIESKLEHALITFAEVSVIVVVPTGIPACQGRQGTFIKSLGNFYSIPVRLVSAGWTRPTGVSRADIELPGQFLF